MKAEKYLTLNIFILSALFFSFSTVTGGQTAAGGLLAGFRASRILESYPDSTFPVPLYWVSVGSRMSSKFPQAHPASIWIVSLYTGKGATEINFPVDGSYRYIYSLEEDNNEAYLDSFDTAGFKIYLQVEPGNANVDTLIDLVLNRYKNHPCVAGFGIDVEYNRKSDVPSSPEFIGRQVTNAEAERWEKHVKEHNPEYRLFLKHFQVDRMPPDYRGNIIFTDDGQQFNNKQELVDDFTIWGNTFKDNPVWFQYGYEADEKWWSNFNDPAFDIGNSLISSIPNTAGLFWVDFTVIKVFPVLSVINGNTGLNMYSLKQNYPNPFNSQTKITWFLPEPGVVSLQLNDVLGREIKTLYSGYMEAGEHFYDLSMNNFSAGVYLYKLTVSSQSGKYSDCKKLVLLK